VPEHALKKPAFLARLRILVDSPKNGLFLEGILRVLSEQVGQLGEARLVVAVAQAAVCQKKAG
jgi:hypothetical protein